MLCQAYSNHVIRLNPNPNNSVCLCLCVCLQDVVFPLEGQVKPEHVVTGMRN